MIRFLLCATAAVGLAPVAMFTLLMLEDMHRTARGQKVIVTGPVRRWIACRLLRLRMLADLPLSLAGLRGVPEAPLLFSAGDRVPRWLWGTYPSKLTFRFGVDCAVYWQYGALHVKPLAWTQSAVLQGDVEGGYFLEGGVCLGAPTHIHAPPIYPATPEAA